MPASFSNLSADEATLYRDFGNGSTLTIRYRPSQLTPRDMHRLQELRNRPTQLLTPAEEAELIDSTSKALVDCVIAWDLTDDHEHPIAPTVEGLADVPYVAQAALLELINEDQRESKLTGSAQLQASSTQGLVSLPMQNSASPALPTGMSSSPSPNGSVFP